MGRGRCVAVRTRNRRAVESEGRFAGPTKPREAALLGMMFLSNDLVRSSQRRGLMIGNRKNDGLRPWWFHWIANTVFLLVLDLPFAITGSSGTVFIVLIATPVMALIFVPITRRWERRNWPIKDGDGRPEQS